MATLNGMSRLVGTPVLTKVATHGRLRRAASRSLAPASDPISQRSSTATTPWHARRGASLVGLCTLASTIPERLSVGKAQRSAASRLGTIPGEKCELGNGKGSVQAP